MYRENLTNFAIKSIKNVTHRKRSEPSWIDEFMILLWFEPLFSQVSRFRQGCQFLNLNLSQHRSQVLTEGKFEWVKWQPFLADLAGCKLYILEMFSLINRPFYSWPSSEPFFWHFCIRLMFQGEKRFFYKYRFPWKK